MRTGIWITLAVLALGYVIFAFLTVDHSNDQAQIAALIERGTKAVQDRDMSRLISCISRNYKDESDLNYDRLRIILAQAMRNETNYTVTTTTKSTSIDGDKATALLHVVIKHDNKGDVFYERNLTVILAKEDGYHAMIIPVKMWRVVGSRDLGLGMSDATF